MAPLILFVEDEVIIADMMEAALAEAGFGVEHATSAAAAAILLDADHTRFVALVTDVGLPGTQTGWDLARRARELNPEIPVVYMTGGHAAEWPAQGVPKSILINKPYAPAQVITAVSSLINTGSAPG